jgi:carbamoyltransferase
MLLDFKIPERFHKEMEGAVHANGTARIQTISSEKDNPFIFHLLSYLEEKHNIRALINTSFNGKGEPIVQTPAEGMQSAKNMKLSNIVINGKLLKI